MKYILIYYQKDGDSFDKHFETKEEAIDYADRKWEVYLTASEKKNIDSYFILESINPDEEAENHYDGNYVKVYKLDGVEMDNYEKNNEMNRHEKIAYKNIKACFLYEVGGWYNCIEDGCEEYIPDTKKEAMKCIYDGAMNDLYGKGYHGCGKAPKEMRFAGKEFCMSVIEYLFKDDPDGDVAEISEVKNWEA